MTRNQLGNGQSAMNKLETSGISVDKDGLAGAAAPAMTVSEDGAGGVDTGQSRRSVLLIAGLLVLSLLAWAATSAYGAGSGSGGMGAGGGSGESSAGGAGGAGGATGTKYLAQVKSGDGQVYQLPLEDDGFLEVSTPLGINIIVVSNGQVYVEEADCPGGDCLRQGGISRPGQTIVCLPHRLVVEVIAASADGSGGPGDSGSGTEDTGTNSGSAAGGGGSGGGSGGGQQHPTVDTVSE